MLYLPDSNILIYAEIAGTPDHKVALEWLSTALNDPNTKLLVCETTILSYLRITTNQKVFDPPLPFSQAALFASKLLASKNVRFHRASAGHFVEVANFMQEHKLGGNLVMDVHLALAAIETGATIVTRDRDFKKIPYLKILDPFETGQQ